MWSRCMTATSHSSTFGFPPMISPPRLRIGARCTSLACMASSELHELVTMHCPVSRSTSMDSPTQPSMAMIAGMTSSRT